jgi:hypothetical protein
MGLGVKGWRIGRMEVGGIELWRGWMEREAVVHVHTSILPPVHL